MMPNITRGGNTVGLLAYLLGEGRANEHVDQHIIAGSSSLMFQFGNRALTHERSIARWSSFRS